MKLDIRVESVLSSSEASPLSETTEAETWFPTSGMEEESDKESKKTQKKIKKTYKNKNKWRDGRELGKGL
jgi:hypothetical protein